MQRIIITFTVLLFCLGARFSSNAQDIHFSQFYNSPQNINPALTGVFPEDLRFIGHYRRQWQSVPVPYLTFSGAFDTKLHHRIARNGFFGYGAVFNYDRQGIAELRLTQLSLSGSYTQQLNEFNLLTLGLQVGTANRAFSTEELTFMNQFNGDIFDPSLPSRENFDQTDITFLDFGTGLNWHLQLDGGFRLDAGVGMFHLSRPQQNFYNETDANLSYRFSTYAIGSAPLNPQMDILFRFINQRQGVYQEFLTGAALAYHLNTNRGKEISLSLGTNFRYSEESEALIPTFGLRYLMWRGEVSYDINLSQFRTATAGNGGPEISLIYTITKVKPPKAFKACPIF